MVVTKGPDGNLVVFTEEKFREVAQEEMARPRVRETRRDMRQVAAADSKRWTPRGGSPSSPACGSTPASRAPRRSPWSECSTGSRSGMWPPRAGQAAADALYRERGDTRLLETDVTTAGSWSAPRIPMEGP